MKPLSVLCIFLVLALSLGCETTPKQVQAVQGEAVDNLNSNYKAVTGRTVKLYEKQATSDAEMIRDLLTQQGDPAVEVNAVYAEKVSEIEANVKQTQLDLEKIEKDYKLYKELERASQ